MASFSPDIQAEIDSLVAHIRDEEHQTRLRLEKTFKATITALSYQRNTHADTIVNLMVQIDDYKEHKTALEETIIILQNRMTSMTIAHDEKLKLAEADRDALHRQLTTKTDAEPNKTGEAVETPVDTIVDIAS